MAIRLLDTKIYLPPPIDGRIDRVRLIERLEQAVQTRCRLIMVSAMAGAGKSTLKPNGVVISQDNWPGYPWTGKIMKSPYSGLTWLLLYNRLSPVFPVPSWRNYYLRNLLPFKRSFQNLSTRQHNCHLHWFLCWTIITRSKTQIFMTAWCIS
jgi:hypothetical protein